MEYIKPTKRKIILFLLIFVVLVPFIQYDTGIRCIQAPCPAADVGSVFKFVKNSKGFVEIEYINFSVGLVISYLAACGLIFMHKNLRNRHV
jgi:hypothetical protein